MMESADIQLVSQSQATFSAPRLLSQKQTAAVEAAGSRVEASVPANCGVSSTVTVSEEAAAENHLLVLKMLAQQSNTAQIAPDVGTASQPRVITTQQRIQIPLTQGLPLDSAPGQGGEVAAAISMLPSPLPLDLTSTGMALQPQLGSAPLASLHQHQQLLQNSIQHPHMQLQYPAGHQQLLPAAQLQQYQLQHAVQQQYQSQQLQQQVASAAAVPDMLAASAIVAAPAPKEQLEVLSGAAPLPVQEDDGAHQQQAATAAASGPFDMDHDRQPLADQTPKRDTPAAAAGFAEDHPMQPEGRDTAEPSSLTHSGDASGQLDAAAAEHDAPPGSSAGGSSGAGGGSGGGANRGSKYGAKRAAALKRQGYTNSVPGPNGNGKSNFRGVFWDRKNSRWRAQVGYNNRKIFMGYFGEPAEAARAYDKKVVQLHGALAKTNFPLEEYAEDLRAFNQQQQEQQLMSQQQLMHRPRRIRRKHRHNSDSSDMSDGAADDEYMDTDHGRGGAVPPAGGGAVPPHANLAMYSQVPAGGFSAVVPHAVQSGSGVVQQQMGPAMGLYMPGAVGQPDRGDLGLVTGYPADPAAAAAAALGSYYGPAAVAGGHGDDGVKGDLPADVAAAVAAAAALAGVAVGDKDTAGSLKRKTPEGETQGNDVATAAAATVVEKAAVDGTGDAQDGASAADRAAAAGAEGGTKVATEAYTEQLPALPAAAAAAAADYQQQQHAAWDQGAVLPAHRYSWTGGNMDPDTAAAAALPPLAAAPQRHSSSSIKQYSWHHDDVAGGTAAGRASSPPTWLPTPPPHLTWQDHMKNLEASLINAGKKDADKDGQDRDLNRKAVDSSAGRSGDVSGFSRGGVGSSSIGVAGAGYANRWQRLLADLSAADAEAGPGQHKGSWRQQQQPVDTDGLSALLAIAAAAEANDVGPSAAAAEGFEAGADALAGLLSIATAAGASSTTAAAAEDGGSVVLTKEQEKEWLYLTGSLAAAMSGSVGPAAAKNRVNHHMTAELLAGIRILAQPNAPPPASAVEQQGDAAAAVTDVECGLPLEVLKTVEHWMLEPNHQQQQHLYVPSAVNAHDVSLAEALACASEAGLTAEARQMYMLVLYQVLCRTHKLLRQQQQQRQCVVVNKLDKAAGTKVELASSTAVTQTADQTPGDQSAGVEPGKVASLEQAVLPAEQRQQQQQVGEQQGGSLADAAIDGQKQMTPVHAAAAAVASQGVPVAICNDSIAAGIDRAHLEDKCNDRQQSHISPATVPAHQLAKGVVAGADVAAAAAAVVQVSGGSAADHVSPGAAGRLSRWGSGTEGVMDFS